MFGLINTRYDGVTQVEGVIDASNIATSQSVSLYTPAALNGDISHIFDNGFDGTNINLSYMFNGCVLITGTVPADKLWASGKTFTSTACFKGCTKLSNYSEIPAGWK